MSMIGVYADWADIDGPLRLGWLHARKTRMSEKFEYECDPLALKNRALSAIRIDPGISPYTGAQFPANGRNIFGVFSDSCPDRWGRLLMKRRLERDIRDGTSSPDTRLGESDYLLGVHDLYRSGALRYRLNDAGNFLDDQHSIAAPPFVELHALETASRALENDPENRAPEGQEWLRMLIAPGGSLGGARPKASVADSDGHLWIAKFPSTRDTYDVGGWELVVNALAKGCGLRETV